jgi:hypothetical protein
MAALASCVLLAKFAVVSVMMAPAASRMRNPPLGLATIEPNDVWMPAYAPSVMGLNGAKVVCAATMGVLSCRGAAPPKETETRKAEADATASSTRAFPTGTTTPCGVAVSAEAPPTRKAIRLCMDT